ncbi:hypothetical protein D9611_014752 [Ephemerocybe angulata]|uniref:Uncharacterized protein n=1 Tax=Ephemerocybe angulata TaxID=980116 RepID=A0A8H5EZS8_9AGAR|nr:hypothetical protein D9611_014752 [Tulosesus angulatus]
MCMHSPSSSKSSVAVVGGLCERRAHRESVGLAVVVVVVEGLAKVAFRRVYGSTGVCWRSIGDDAVDPSLPHPLPFACIDIHRPSSTPCKSRRGLEGMVDAHHPFASGAVVSLASTDLVATDSNGRGRCVGRRRCARPVRGMCAVEVVVEGLSEVVLGSGLLSTTTTTFFAFTSVAVALIPFVVDGPGTPSWCREVVHNHPVGWGVAPSSSSSACA